MRLAPEIIAALVASELNAAQLALLLELVSVMSIGLSSGSQVESPDGAVSRRRKYDREYKAKRRAADKSASNVLSSGLSIGQSGHGTDEEEATEEVVIEKKKPTASVVEGQKAKSARGSRLFVGAPLVSEFQEAAIGLGMHPEAVAGAWAEFVDYWAALPGQRGCKTNWLATWRNRVRQVASKSPRNLQVIHGASQPRPGSVPAAFRAIREQLESEAGRGGEAGGNPVLRLSSG